MGSYPAARAGFHHRSRRAAHDRRELCLPGKPAGRGSGGRLAVARQAGEIAATQSGHGRRRQAPDGHAARRVLGVALTATDIDSSLDRRTRGLPSSQGIYRTAAERRGDAASSNKLRRLDADQRWDPGLNLHFYWVFVRYNICCGKARVDHNMLSIRGTWAHDRLQTPTGWRVLPTVAPFVLSPQSVGIMGAD